MGSHFNENLFMDSFFSSVSSGLLHLGATLGSCTLLCEARPNEAGKTWCIWQRTGRSLGDAALAWGTTREGLEQVSLHGTARLGATSRSGDLGSHLS